MGHDSGNSGSIAYVGAVPYPRLLENNMVVKFSVLKSDRTNFTDKNILDESY